MDNSILKIYRYARDLLVYKPSRNPTRFVLEESHEASEVSASELPPTALTAAKAELEKLLRYAKRLAEAMNQASQAMHSGHEEELEQLKELLINLEKQKAELSPVRAAYDANSTDCCDRPISASIEENQKLLEQIYQIKNNKDIIIRHFTIAGNKPVKAMLVFMDGMIDKSIINLGILQPLLLLDTQKQELQDGNILKQLVSRYLPSNQAQEISIMGKAVEGINTGDTALFLEGCTQAALVETKGYEHRSAAKPEIEQSVRGAQVAFTETLRANTGMIRTMLPSADLITEMLDVGDRITTKCAIMYLQSVANRQLVNEVRRRIDNISTDYIPDIGVLEQYIEDHPMIALPQTFSTERPDRVVAALAEGRVAILLNGSPFAHIVPVGFFSFFHSADDFSLKVPIGTFLRVLRLLGTLVAVVLPAVYLAISYFHQEALPTEMVLAIAGARERVPLPAIGEVLLMEFAFELIREAGLRIPGLLGSTIGIVGAIILGQAAVTANLVSPITVVVIAITGLASFTIPDYRLSAALRLARFGYIALAAAEGLVGIAFGLLVNAALLCTMKSFGMPYMVPVAPKTMTGLDIIVRGPVFRQELRPDQLNPQDIRRQPHIARKWTLEPPANKEDKP